LQATQISLFSEEDGYPFDLTGVVQRIESGYGGSLESQSPWMKTSIAQDLAVGDVVRVTGRIRPDGSWRLPAGFRPPSNSSIPSRSSDVWRALTHGE
jgi:hypothetical protein